MFSNLSDTGNIVMAGNPCIFKGTSGITANQFPCVLATFTASTGYSEDYTYPLSSTGKFQFDISGALQETFRQLQRATIGNDGYPVHTPQAITYSVVLKEQYYANGVVYVDESTKQTYTGKYAIPGALTDYERLKMSGENIATLLGSIKLLSRKPSYDDICVKDTKHYVPYVKVTDGVPTLAYSTSKRSTKGSQTITIEGLSPSPKVYVCENDGNYIPLIFWNQFGLLESAVGYAKPIFQHNITTTQYAVSEEEPNFHSISQQKSRTKLDSQTITINTGLLSRQWYEWFVGEVLTSPQVWIYLNNVWHSGTIVPESSIKYESDKGESLSIEFKVKLSVAGSIYNSFV